MNKIICPKCGGHNYIRERRPNGDTECRDCGFCCPSNKWDNVVAEVKMDKYVNDKYRDQDFDKYWMSTFKGMSSSDVIRYREIGRSEAYGVWMARQVEINNLEREIQMLKTALSSAMSEK